MAKTHTIEPTDAEKALTVREHKAMNSYIAAYETFSHKVDNELSTPMNDANKVALFAGFLNWGKL